MMRKDAFVSFVPTLLGEQHAKSIAIRYRGRAEFSNVTSAVVVLEQSAEMWSKASHSEATFLCFAVGPAPTDLLALPENNYFNNTIIKWTCRSSICATSF